MSAKQSLMDVDSIKERNWCRYLLEGLSKSKEKWNKNESSFYHGPLTFLMLFYLDRVLYKNNHERRFPAISCWDQKSFIARINDEKNDGGYGRGRPIERIELPTLPSPQVQVFPAESNQDNQTIESDEDLEIPLNSIVTARRMSKRVGRKPAKLLSPVEERKKKRKKYQFLAEELELETASPDDGAGQNNEEQHANGESFHSQDNQVVDGHAYTLEEAAHSDLVMTDFEYNEEDSHPNAETRKDNNTDKNQTTEEVPSRRELVVDDDHGDIETIEKVWHYVDPQGVVQGPFSLVSLKLWHSYNYFHSNFMIWKTGQNQSEAVLLVDVIQRVFA